MKRLKAMVDLLTKMPWTWRGPIEVDDEEVAYYELRIAELPDFFVAGSSPSEVNAEREEALRAFLASYVERGEAPPLEHARLTIVHDPPPETGNARRSVSGRRQR